MNILINLVIAIAALTAEPISVEVVVDSPQHYDQQMITVYGLLVAEFENTALYVGPVADDGSHTNDKQQRLAIWLEPIDTTNWNDALYSEYLVIEKKLKTMHGHCVEITGTYLANKHGHLNLFHSTLSDLSFIIDSNRCGTGSPDKDSSGQGSIKKRES